MAQIVVKAKCKGITRILKTAKDVNYVDFSALIEESFGITQYQLQYKDEEGDLIHVGSEDELKEAVKVAERFGPLKVIILTSEKPRMDLGNKVTNSPQSPVSAMQSTSTSQTDGPGTSHEDPQDNLADTFTGLQLNTSSARSRQTVQSVAPCVPKRNRKRIGFYASLCNDVKSLGLVGNENTMEVPAPEKPKKKQKCSSSKYYSSLAAEVAAMNLLQAENTQCDTSCNTAAPAPEPEPAKPSSDVPEETLPKGGLSESSSASDLEIMTENLPLKEEGGNPPSWFNSAISHLKETISSEVVNALNGAVIASVSTVNEQPAQPVVKRDPATYVHDGIVCDSCHQPIVGTRYKCGNCPDYDLCEKCEQIEGVHTSSHVFLKLRYPNIGIGRKHGVMVPLLDDIIYKSKDVKQAEEQVRTMKEVRKKLKQLAKKKREEQVRLKKGERKLKKFKGSNHSDGLWCEFNLEFLGDGSYPDGTEVPPGHEFTKIWKIKNTGSFAWNAKSKLVSRYGAIHFLCHEVDLPRLQPSEEGTISVQFVASAIPGQYNSVWRASQDGTVFGSQLWCKIVVASKQKQISDVENEAFVDAPDEPMVPRGVPTTQITRPPFPLATRDAAQQAPQDVEVPQGTVENAGEHGSAVPADSESEQLSVVSEEPTGESEVEASPSEVEASSEADVSPSEVSHVTGELEWDTCMLESGDEEENIEDNDDDLLDIEVISNASSDDYCVVPLPACFNPDIPLRTDDEDPQFLENEASLNQPNSEDVESLVERNLMQFSLSDPIPIKDKAAGTSKDNPDTLAHELSTALYIDTPTTPKLKPRRVTASLPVFPLESAVSEPVAPQPPQIERTAFVPRKLPASPPGRAVPVIQPTLDPPMAPTRNAISIPPSWPMAREEPPSESDAIGQASPQTVCIQPPESTTISPTFSETTVTSQPSAVTTVSTSPRSTAQYASTLVSGTLETAKRAIGTVTGTVTTFINGQSASVSYNHAGDNVQIMTTTTDPLRASPEITAMQQLIDMGFCDRPLNERLLKKHKNDVNEVALELVNENDNDWSRDRHTVNN